MMLCRTHSGRRGSVRVRIREWVTDPRREHEAPQHHEGGDLSEVAGGDGAHTAVAIKPFVDDAFGLGGVLDERHHGAEIG